MPAKAAPAKIEKSAIYDQLESLLKTYSPPFTICPTGKVGKKRSYGLWSKKDVKINGRDYPAAYFASVIEQKDFIGFYSMSSYMDTELSASISPRLLKLLKGKSCFHIKALDAELLSQLKTMLDAALKAYKKNGWL